MVAQAELKKHAALFDQMAGHVGVDLERAIETDGSLSLDELGDAVLRCAGCSDPGHCAGWMAEQAGVASDAPSYCRNTDLFSRLKSG